MKCKWDVKLLSKQGHMYSTVQSIIQPKIPVVDFKAFSPYKKSFSQWEDKRSVTDTVKIVMALYLGDLHTV